MRAADLSELAALAALIHPTYPERDEVFAERLQLAAFGCRVATRGGSLVGYLLSHPWRGSSPPPLDILLGSLPDDPGCWYIHDLAVLPDSRAGGLGSTAVEWVKHRAVSSGLSRIELTAVAGSKRFWKRCGFRRVAEQPDSLRSYGTGALLMAWEAPRPG